MDKPKENTTRRFRLIEELELAEKNKESNTFSLGLEDSEDRSLTHWNGLIFGPPGTNFSNGLYTLKIVTGPNYPLQPPLVKFITKINIPSVNKSNGEVDPKTFPILAKWKKETKLNEILSALLNEMKSNPKLPQPKEGENF